ncbi:LLM class flavin-dependent oxidoreductase [Paenibacillus pabuli]|uniref:LLM class flavin-dependent oxidoreductase n=1 Tax=Paenibacillus pabuli TaxID=1472 RepID=UPI003241BD16
MLGSSDGGLSLAAKFGLKFAFAGQLNPRQDVQLLKQYKHRFEAKGHEEKPYSILSKFIFVADTEEEAKLAALPAEISWMRMYKGSKTEELQLISVEEAANYEFTPLELAIREQNKGRFIIGNPEQVKTQIQELERTALIDDYICQSMWYCRGTRTLCHFGLVGYLKGKVR